MPSPPPFADDYFQLSKAVLKCSGHKLLLGRENECKVFEWILHSKVTFNTFWKDPRKACKTARGEWKGILMSRADHCRYERSFLTRSGKSFDL